MAHQVQIGKEAAEGLRAMPAAEQAKMSDKIRAPAENPRPPGHKKLKGRSNAYRIRQGDYRAVYSIDDKGIPKIVKVEKVGHRKEIYD